MSEQEDNAAEILSLNLQADPPGPEHLQDDEQEAAHGSRILGHPEYQDIENRRKSFRFWFYDDIISSELLARAGYFYEIVLYYTDRRVPRHVWSELPDRTVCAYCGGVVLNWQQGDDPYERHKEVFFSYCAEKDQAVDSLDIVREINGLNCGSNVSNMSNMGIAENREQRS